MYDYIFKVTIIGTFGVGKTALMERFCDGYFKGNHLSTIGVDFRNKEIETDDKIVKLQVWDTAGQERYKAIAKSYLRATNGIILCFDLSQSGTLVEAQYWLDIIRQHADKNTAVFLVGNKSDLKRDVTADVANDFANRESLPYFETSAKEATNVNSTFEAMAMELVHALKGRLGADQATAHLSIDSSSSENSFISRCSC